MAVDDSDDRDRARTPQFTADDGNQERLPDPPTEARGLTMAIAYAPDSRGTRLLGETFQLKRSAPADTVRRTSRRTRSRVGG